MRTRTMGSVCAGIFAAAAAGSAMAGSIELKVTVENIAPTNSVTFSPLSVGFNSGVYDAFNVGETATAPIVGIAEFGSPADWFPAFMAADPGATLGSVGGAPIQPGMSGMATFAVDPLANPYFTFGAMVVPSNDSFIGNDSPTEYQLFDMAGNLNVSSITLNGGDIWDAGSEVDGVFGAAFLEGSSAADKIPDDDVVTADFAGLSIFNGLTTAAGYTFNSQLAAGTDIFRISFEVVPEPATALLLVLGGLVGIRRR